VDEAVEIRREFARRQSTQRTIQRWGIAMGLVALVGITTCGSAGRLLIWVCLPVLAGLLAWTFKNWRCPHCGRLLGKRISIIRCPYCQIEFN
jgi:hypothetical protein